MFGGATFVCCHQTKFVLNHSTALHSVLCFASSLLRTWPTRKNWGGETKVEHLVLDQKCMENYEKCPKWTVLGNTVIGLVVCSFSLLYNNQTPFVRRHPYLKLIAAASFVFHSINVISDVICMNFLSFGDTVCCHCQVCYCFVVQCGLSKFHQWWQSD